MGLFSGKQFYHIKPKRLTEISFALEHMECESCHSIDRMIPIDQPYIDKYGWINFRAHCMDCVCLTKWRYKGGELVRR